MFLSDLLVNVSIGEIILLLKGTMNKINIISIKFLLKKCNFFTFYKGKLTNAQGFTRVN